MKTKILSVLFGLFMIISQNASAWCILSCHSSGRCVLLDLIMYPDGTAYLVSSEDAGFCAGGPWYLILNRVVPTGSPATPELSSSGYGNLSSTSRIISPDSTVLAVADSAAHNFSSATQVWVNPLSLSSDAYSFIYSGAAYLDIFYVHPSINSIDGSALLNLYSDNGRTVSVTYKNLTGSTVGTENVTVSTGSNCKSLSVPSTLSNGYYTMIVTTENGIVSTSISVNN